MPSFNFEFGRTHSGFKGKQLLGYNEVSQSDNENHNTAGFNQQIPEMSSTDKINDSNPMSVEKHLSTPEMKPKTLASFIKDEQWSSRQMQKKNDFQKILSLSSQDKIENVRQPSGVDHGQQKLIGFLGAFKNQTEKVSLPKFPSVTGSRPSLDMLDLIEETKEDDDESHFMSLMPPIRELIKKNPTNNHRN